MANDDWYEIADLPPNMVLYVNLRWGWWDGAAARVRHPKTRQWGWAVIGEDREYHFLPPRGKAGSTWPDAPSCWQPRDPDKFWVAGMRKPLPRKDQVLPQMATLKSRYDAVAEAIEEERAAGLAHNSGGDDRWWWPDGSVIRYERKREVSLRMAEGRVMRAVAHCGLRKTKATPTERAVVAEELARLMQEMEQSDSRVIVERFKPLPQDHQDFDEAMSWFTALNPPELWHKRREPWTPNRFQWALFYRAIPVPLSWAEIGHELGKVRFSRAQQLYDEAIEACWRVANGRQAYKHLTVKDQIAALRERNRAYHQQQRKDDPL